MCGEILVSEDSIYIREGETLLSKEKRDRVNKVWDEAFASPRMHSPIKPLIIISSLIDDDAGEQPDEGSE